MLICSQKVIFLSVCVWSYMTSSCDAHLSHKQTHNPYPSGFFCPTCGKPRTTVYKSINKPKRRKSRYLGCVFLDCVDLINFTVYFQVLLAKFVLVVLTILNIRREEGGTLVQWLKLSA